jgi:hypothetical protein
MTPDESRFRSLVVANPAIAALIDRLPALALPDCWIASSAVTQTVWNMLEGRDPREGIRDYDVFYFDPDVSFEAEDRAIRRTAEAFADIDADIELRNEARVHLWFDARHGADGYPRLASSCCAIDLFLETPTMFGLHPTGGGAFDVYAPLGYGDLFGFVFRPNPAAIGPAMSYAEKAAKRQAQYPRLKVIPWDAATRAEAELVKSKQAKEFSSVISAFPAASNSTPFA